MREDKFSHHPFTLFLASAGRISDSFTNETEILVFTGFHLCENLYIHPSIYPSFGVPPGGTDMANSIQEV